MDSNLIHSGLWNSSLLAAFFAVGAIKSCIRKEPIWAAIAGFATYATICDAVKFYNLM